MGPLLFASYSPTFGGAERVLLDAAQAVRGAACLACPEGPLAARARAQGMTVLAIPERRVNLRAGMRDLAATPARLAAHGRELRALADDLGARAVVAWGMRSAIATLALPASVPVAVAHHDLLPDPVAAAAVRAAAGRARVVIVPSRTVADDLDPLARLADRLAIVTPGVALERFAAERRPTQPPEVVVLGTLVGWKRPDLALEAVALARRQVPELRVRLLGAVMGGDPIAQRLRQRAAADDLAGAVAFEGQCDEPERWLARAACLLHCAPREPFGLAVAEALAAGCPAVVPDSGGPAEIVDDACAVRYPPGNAAAAARAIVSIVADPQRAAAMGSAGRHRARARFDREHALGELARALDPVTRAGGRRLTRGEADPHALTIVTVTHNSARVLAGLLDSVARHLPQTRVIVVDGASSDGTPDLCAGRPEVTVMPLRDNVGFGTACNRGLEQVRTPVAALVNPDVELVDDSLLELAHEALHAGRAPRLLAPLVLSGDGRRQDTAHPSPGSGADLVRALVPAVVLPGRLGAAAAPWRSSEARRIGWAVGCALVAPTATLRALGPFDERFFLYGEDMELGLRAARDGVETWLWPTARIVHHRAHARDAAFGGEPFVRLAQARHDAVARALGPRRAALDDLAQAATFGSRIALKAALGIDAARERRQLRALRRS